MTDERALADVTAAVCDAYDRIDVVDVSLLGSVATARVFLPALLESRGYLLQVASLAALAPAPMTAAYCARKSGVEALAHALPAEVAHHGVRVGVAYLSWTDTELARGADESAALGGMRADCRSQPTAPAPPRQQSTLYAGSASVRRARTRSAGWRQYRCSGAVPPVAARFAARTMPQVESRWLATGGEPEPLGRAATRTRRPGAVRACDIVAAPAFVRATKETRG